MIIKIFTCLLILVVVFMGFKQGWAMFKGSNEMLTMFSKWNFNKDGVRIFGIITLIGAILILFPKTYLIGNFLMAATILLILCLQLSVRDIKGAAIELPFILLNLLLIYLQYPLTKKI